MAQPPRRQQIYTIACRCGAHAAVHVNTFNRPQTCRQCKGTYTVTWKKDPRGGGWVPIVVAKAKVRTLAAKAPAPPPGSLLTLKCSCGYQRQAPAKDAGQGQRCPGCNKWMVVEKPSGTKRKPAKSAVLPGSLAMPLPPEFKRLNPTPPKPTSSPAAPVPEAPTAKTVPAPQLPPGAQLVECPCGERILVRSKHVGKEAKCPACDRILKLEKKRDPQTMVFTISPTEVAQSSEKDLPTLEFMEIETPKAKRTAASPLPGIDCACGTRIPLEAVMKDKGTSCPTCGRKVKMERVRHPQSTVTLMRPAFENSPGMPAVEEDQGMFFTSGPEDTATPTPVEAEAGQQELICQCGQELLVGPDDLGHHVQCPGCLALMEIQGVRDPATGALSLRAQVEAKSGDDPWSLEDFK